MLRTDPCNLPVKLNEHPIVNDRKGRELDALPRLEEEPVMHHARHLMRRIARHLLVIAVVGAASVPTAAMAGPWTLEQGKTYNKPAVNFFTGNSIFGTQQDGFVVFEDLNFTYYNETGITDNLSFIASIPIKEIRRVDRNAAGVPVTQRTTGVGDIDLGLRYNLSKGPIVVAVQGLFKLPYAYNRNNPLPLGNGQEDFEGRLQLGRGFGKAGYVVVEAGYRYRVGAPSDEFRYLVEYGVDLGKSTYVRTKLDGIASIRNETRLIAANRNPTLPLAFDLAKLELTAGRRITKKLGVEFTVTPNIYGDNTLTGTNFQLALVLLL